MTLEIAGAEPAGRTIPCEGSSGRAPWFATEVGGENPSPCTIQRGRSSEQSAPGQPGEVGGLRPPDPTISALVVTTPGPQAVPARNTKDVCGGRKRLSNCRLLVRLHAVPPAGLSVSLGKERMGPVAMLNRVAAGTEQNALHQLCKHGFPRQMEQFTDLLFLVGSVKVMEVKRYNIFGVAAVLTSPSQKGYGAAFGSVLANPSHAGPAVTPAALPNRLSAYSARGAGAQRSGSVGANRLSSVVRSERCARQTESTRPKVSPLSVYHDPVGKRGSAVLARRHAILVAQRGGVPQHKRLAELHRSSPQLT